VLIYATSIIGIGNYDNYLVNLKLMQSKHFSTIHYTDIKSPPTEVFDRLWYSRICAEKGRWTPTNQPTELFV